MKTAVFSGKSRALAEAGVMLALAQLLSFIQLFHLPYGGAVTPASMLPVILFAVRWGPRWGLGTGLAYGVLQFLLGAKYPAPFGNQLLAYGSVIALDYLAAFGVMGFAAGLFKGRRPELVLGVPAACAARFAAHFLSGVFLWSSFAETLPPALYSLVYNGSYMGAEAVICLLLALAVMKPLDKYISGRDLRAN